MKKVLLFLCLIFPLSSFADGNRVNYAFIGYDFTRHDFASRVTQEFIVSKNGVGDPASYYKKENNYFHNPSTNKYLYLTFGIGWGSLYNNFRSEAYAGYYRYRLGYKFNLTNIPNQEMSWEKSQIAFISGYNIYYDFNQLRYWSSFENYVIPYIGAGIYTKYAYNSDRAFSKEGFKFDNDFSRDFLMSGLLTLGLTVNLSDSFTVDIGTKLIYEQSSTYSAYSNTITADSKVNQKFVRVSSQPIIYSGTVKLMYKF